MNVRIPIAILQNINKHSNTLIGLQKQIDALKSHDVSIHAVHQNGSIVKLDTDVQNEMFQSNLKILKRHYDELELEFMQEMRDIVVKK